MNKNQIHANRKEDWETPSHIFEPLNNLFKFTVDLAANEHNKKCDKWIGPGSPIWRDFFAYQPSLDDTHWINPPYGKNLKRFTKKICQLSRENFKIVALLPGSIDVEWFWDNVYGLANVYGRRGRIQFVSSDLFRRHKGNSGNPGPSILAVYNIPEVKCIPGWLPLYLKPNLWW